MGMGTGELGEKLLRVLRFVHRQLRLCSPWEDACPVKSVALVPKVAALQRAHPRVGVSKV